MRIQRFVRLFLILLAAVAVAAFAASCGDRSQGAFVIALESTPETLDPLRGTDAQSERLRQLMFNSLVRKNERFDYVGELATNIQPAEDGSSVTFTLRDGVTFHDGRALTAADAKYTIETLLSSDSKKNPPFFEGTGDARESRLAGVDAPDARTLVIRLRKPWLELLANLVNIPVIPQGTADAQKTTPLGSGAFRFVSYDEAQEVVDMAAHENYWEGAPSIKNLRVRVIRDANTLQAELRSGRIDLVVAASNLTADAYKSLGQDPNLKVEQFPGANINYIGFNAESEPVRDARVRQAIAYAINREALVRDLLFDQARIAHSILPEESWAYAPGQKYSYDPEQAKKILDEAGYRAPAGGGARFSKPVAFKINAGSAAVRQYASVIQNSLKEVGIPVEIETLEFNSLLAQLRNGQYQMTTSRWVGGNQDPIFLRDLFTTGAAFNRGRYSNTEVDRLLQEAVTTLDREKAKTLYTQAQEIVSREVPMLPLWYPANMIVARRNVGNIKVDPSSDWSFVRKLTIENK